jgi:hypothetical protein
MIAADRRWYRVLAGVGVLLWVAQGCTPATHNRMAGPGGRPRYRLEIAELEHQDGSSTVSGQWRAEGPWDELRGDDRIELAARSTVGESSFGFTRGLKPDELVGVLPGRSTDPATVTEFHVRRQAGTLAFNGDPDGKSWQGRFRLDIEPTYVRQIETLLTGPIMPSHWLVLVDDDVSPDDVRAYTELGMPATVEAVIRLRSSGVSPEYIAALTDAGYTVSIDDLVRLKQRGVSAEYAAALKRAGYAFTPKELIDLKWRGVSSDFARQFREAGYEFSADELIKLTWRGVRPQTAGQFKDGGYDLSVDELIKLKWRGVTSGYAVAMKQAGYDFTVDELIKLKWRGVTPEFAKGMKEAGYDFTVDELIKLKWRGIRPKFAAVLHNPDATNLTVDEIIQLRNTGLTPGTIRKIRVGPVRPWHLQRPDVLRMEFLAAWRLCWGRHALGIWLPQLHATFAAELRSGS